MSTGFNTDETLLTITHLFYQPKLYFGRQ